MVRVGLSPTRQLLGCIGAGALALALPLSADAGTRQYFVFGGGGGTQAYQTPCPDVPCNTGAVCSCITSTGTLQALPLNGGAGAKLTYSLEVSADNSSGFGNGAGAACYGATGVMSLTAKDGSQMEIDFSAPGCRITSKVKGNNQIFGINAPGIIVAGTGKYAYATGTGSLALVLNNTKKTVTGDIVGTYNPGQ